MPIQEFGLDRLAPLHANRQIHTTSLHWRLREKQWWDGRVALRLGATLSRPTGSITQPGPNGIDLLDSPAWGLGPAVDAQLRLVRGTGWRLQLDTSAAVLLYDRRFPAGGDHYNGMLQLGPSIAWQLPAGRGELELGWRWMHVSNGQGLGPHNPSYEGRGITLRWRLAP